MEKNKNKITFESLSSSTTNDIINEKVENNAELQLVNTTYWNNEIFRQIFFKKNKRFSNDELELKNEFNTWHKEQGFKYYNAFTKDFNFGDVPFKNKKYIYKDIITYLKLHPNLTKLDEKRLETIQNEIQTKFKNALLTNSLMAIMFGISWCKYRSIKLRQTIHQVARANYFNFLFVSILSFIYVDSRFKLKKPDYLKEILKEKGFTTKYYQNYLIKNESI